jgi:hypothetical protein
MNALPYGLKSLEIAICYQSKTQEIQAKHRLQFSHPVRRNRSYSWAILDAVRPKTREK